MSQQPVALRQVVRDVREVLPAIWIKFYSGAKLITAAFGLAVLLAIPTLAVIIPLCAFLAAQDNQQTWWVMLTGFVAGPILMAGIPWLMYRYIAPRVFGTWFKSRLLSE